MSTATPGRGWSRALAVPDAPLVLVLGRSETQAEQLYGGLERLKTRQPLPPAKLLDAFFEHFQQAPKSRSSLQGEYRDCGRILGELSLARPELKARCMHVLNSWKAEFYGGPAPKAMAPAGLAPKAVAKAPKAAPKAKAVPKAAAGPAPKAAPKAKAAAGPAPPAVAKAVPKAAA